MELEILEQEIGYNFKNKILLRTALTHTSYAYEKQVISNEKLEFLGDSILEFVTSDYIYQKYSYLKEGEMTKVRASVVCESSLHEVAKRHNFSDFLNLGKSERVSRDEVRPAIMADSVEAVIAAIYLDGGLEEARKFIINNLNQAIEIATKHIGEKDYKTVLQEILQRKGNVNIEYRIVREIGPDHDKVFCSEVLCNNKVLAEGNGRSKKLAEMDAAQNALKGLKK